MTNLTESSNNKIKIEARKKGKIIFSSILISTSIIVFGGVFTLGSIVNSAKANAMKTWVMPPTQVSTVKVYKQDWQPILQSTGETSAVNSVAISSQVSGIITDIYFKSGDKVKKGDVLFKLNTKYLEAQLAEAQAQLKLAQITFDRDKKLYSKKAISQQSFDEVEAKLNESIANVKSIQANINYNIIKAPFNGVLGIKNINIGEFFQAGTNAVTLTNLDDININFFIPQNNISNIKINQNVKFYVDTYKDKVFNAKIKAFDSIISNNTKSLEVQAHLNNNQDYILYPGMFITVDVNLPIQKDILTLPRNAINYNIYGQSVFVLTPLKEDGKNVIASYSSIKDGKVVKVSMNQETYIAKEISIKTGLTQGNKVQILSGLKEGSIIVASGQNKVNNNSKVVINNSNKL